MQVMRPSGVIDTVSISGKTQNPVPRGALVAKSERAALAEFSSMNHFGKLVRLNGLRRKNVLIGSRGGSAVSICSLNRWRLDRLNYTNMTSCDVS
ncbi:hypothetical protein CapIbe_018763 [Capra ibex]